MTEIAIVGAGIGGLVLGLGLQRSGHPVAIYEQAARLGELGAGITLSPNAVRVINWLGLGEQLRAVSFTPDRQWTQHWQSGDVLREALRGADFAARHGGAGYYHVHRADLHALLLGALPATTVRLGKALTAVDTDGRMRFADGSTVTADLVVGADGVKSAVRAACFDTAAPQFTGQVAWRGIVPTSALPETVQALPPGIHVGPQRLFMRYPVRGGTLINYAAFVELNGWQDEGWTIPSTIPELLGHFDGWDQTVRAIIAATPAGSLFKWALHTREPLPSWISGRVTLLGDAAHAMLPFMGQGAGTAIEDAAVLARCLAAFPIAEALERYQAVRRERTEMVQTQSRLLGLTFQGKDPASLGRGPLLNEEALGLFDYDPVTVPI
ncbi:MAG: FAD-dependent monooxygenase [Sandarakinorhabdus sp.]|jgi:salicylate hydroxylase|nr:FAD-dependent monooxygenase [Sandarakinorhabdus sp.]